MEIANLCHLDELANGEARGFEIAGSRRRVIVVRKGERVHGYLDSCPHYAGGTPMAWKRDAYLNGDRTHLACHAHGALFDIETGQCVIGPCLGRALTRVPLRIDEAGQIKAEIGLTAEEAA
jgi:naringenin degradation protein FdeD